jgi:predicted dehydrogenase
LRAAIVGLGNSAVHGHLPALARLARDHDLTVVGAADRDAHRRVEIGPTLPSVPLFASAEAMLEAVEADLLIVATDPLAHASLTTLGLDRGLHVVCEKPLALRIADHEAIARAVSARPELALVPVHQYRYSPTWMVMRRWARRADGLGVAYSLAVEVERNGTDPRAASPWREDAAEAGGMLADHGVHFLALAWEIAATIDVVGVARTWDARRRERCRVDARVGRGRLTLRLASDCVERHSRVELRLPGIALRWSDDAVALSVGGRLLRTRPARALSDRGHVDALYLPLYRDVRSSLSDPAWRRERTMEALAVSSALVELLEMATA